jgi:hypothetical protein
MDRLITSLLSLLLFINLSFSQNSEKEPQLFDVNWTVGTEKTVYQVDSTIVYNMDSLFMSTGIKSGYKIKVVSLQDTVYEILFKQMVFDNDISLKSDLMQTESIERVFQELLAELQSKMQDFEYTFLVNKNTAQAFEVKNEEQLMNLIEEVVVIALTHLTKNLEDGMDETKEKLIQDKVEEYINEKMPEAIQTMLNSFNYIFQAYSFPFILDETYRADIEVYQIDQIQYSEHESKAGLAVNSSIQGSVLNIDYEYEYDKESAYLDYIVARDMQDKISIDQFEIEERVISEFDIESSWMTKSTSFVKAKIGDVILNNKTLIIIQ